MSEITREEFEAASKRLVEAIRRTYGSQARAAEVLGVDVSKLSRIAQAKQAPDFGLLYELALRPGVDIHEILTGTAPPGRRTGPRPGGGDRLLPVTTRPAPAPPLEVPELFEGVIRVARPDYAATRYGLRLGPDTLPFRPASREYLAGDLLIVDAAPDALKAADPDEVPTVVVPERGGKATLILPGVPGGIDDRPTLRGYPKLAGVAVSLVRRLPPEVGDARTDRGRGRR